MLNFMRNMEVSSESVRPSPSAWSTPCLSNVTGPNELSIQDVAAIIPLMGPSGLAKGPCTCLTINMSSS